MPTTSRSTVRNTFWQLVSRGAGGRSRPRKYGLSGCIPATVSSAEVSLGRGHERRARQRADARARRRTRGTARGSRQRSWCSEITEARRGCPTGRARRRPRGALRRRGSAAIVAWPTISSPSIRQASCPGRDAVGRLGERERQIAVARAHGAAERALAVAQPHAIERPAGAAPRRAARRCGSRAPSAGRPSPCSRRRRWPARTAACRRRSPGRAAARPCSGERRGGSPTRRPRASRTSPGRSPSAAVTREECLAAGSGEEAQILGVGLARRPPVPRGRASSRTAGLRSSPSGKRSRRDASPGASAASM